MTFHIEADIRQAQTLPATLYTDPVLFAEVKERILARHWHFAGDTDQVRVPGQVQPFTLLEGCLEEPLLWTRDYQDQLHCLSNVCTHRGSILVEQGGIERSLRCRYHGRRFALDGTFQQMPEFEGVANFPTERDNLPAIPFSLWGKWLFTSLEPCIPFEEVIAPVQDRVGWMPFSEFHLDPTRTRDYLVRANWVLYVENYLDALHIPFVHYELASALDYDDYPTENYRYSNLQIGVTQGAEESFELPVSSPDYGKRIAAYYFWLFPTTMLNFYPWGMSLNRIQPLSVDRTKVTFLRYVWDASKTGNQVSADAAVDRVEREDEAVVEAVQRGVRSRFYDRGRYSPTREQGTHFFHRLIAEFLT